MPVDKFLGGISRFQKDVYPEHQDLFEKLALGQRPEALFITCADSRIDPCLLTQTKPGELFICRVIGNIVPPYPDASAAFRRPSNMRWACCGCRKSSSAATPIAGS